MILDHVVEDDDELFGSLDADGELEEAGVEASLLGNRRTEQLVERRAYARPCDVSFPLHEEENWVKRHRIGPKDRAGTW